MKSRTAVISIALTPNLLTIGFALAANLVILQGHRYSDQIPTWYMPVIAGVGIFAVAAHIMVIVVNTESGGHRDPQPERAGLRCLCSALLTIADGTAIALVQFIIAKMLL